jgi:DNA-binding XRE family transcriptional regulator
MKMVQFIRVLGSREPQNNGCSTYLFNIPCRMHRKLIPDHHIKRYDEIRMFIKNYRVNDGLTQRDFGNMAEIHTNTLQNLESGKNITLLTLFGCIDAMGMTISEFFEGLE